MGAADNGAMHLLVPFASALSEAGRHTLRDLALPHLDRALARLAPTARLGTDEYSLTPPHEAALAAARGWQGGAGTLPFAAHAAQADGIEVLDLAWGAPQRWYAAHESLVDLPCASIDRVVGRNVDRWLPEGRPARLLRRLQNEVQMLLYSHPLNDAREAQGALPVNSFWLSGCGRRQDVEGEEPHADTRLRAPLLSEDWAAWAEAWRALDADALAPLADALERGAHCRHRLHHHASCRMVHAASLPSTTICTRSRPLYSSRLSR